MVQTYSAESSFDLPWSVLAHAYLLRYPNPFAKHVLSLDVLDRRILHRNPQDPPVLLTSRLLLKRGTLPSWAPRGLIKNAESWVLEVTEVDLEPSADPPRRRQMRTWTRNLDHTTVLAVAESMTFTEGADAEAAAISDFKGKSREPSTAATSAADQSPIQTHCITSAHITSNVSVLWKRIEKFGLKRFKAHIDTSRQGLLYSASHFSNHQYSHSFSLPPAPSSLARLREALRPPWLDGLPLGPIQKARRFLKDHVGLLQRCRIIKEEGLLGYTGRREREEAMMRWREELGERLVRFRQWRGDTLGPIEEDASWRAKSSWSTRIGDAETSAQGDHPPPQRQGGHRQGAEDESIEVQRERLARLLHEARTGRISIAH